MKKAFLVILMMLGMWVIPFGSGIAAANDDGKVILIHIKNEIDASQVALVHKALHDTKAQGAKAVVVEIDTFGGLVDSAVKIRDMINDQDKTTICYIKNRAWSAGALIALAHQHIAIVPGGSIGAAEPIPATEKTIAALKAEFAATANKNGRNPKIAQAMVDKSLGYPGFAEPGKILALTDQQALEVHYADVIAQNREAMLRHYGLNQAELLEYEIGTSEKIAGWLSTPSVQSIVLAIIFLAILTEIKTAGLGVAGAIGLVFACLFFVSQWGVGMAGWLEVLLFLGGLLLIVCELFIPGVGLFGISGVFSILVSIFLTLGGNFAAINILAISLVLAIFIFLLILKYLPSSKLWHKLILKDAETTQAGFVSGQNYMQYLGKTGVVITGLRPAGIIDIAGVHFDVVSSGQYLAVGTRVKVVNVNGTRMVVEPEIE